MKIVDINGKEREIESIKKIMSTQKDPQGNPILQPFVEVIIIGRSGRRWKEWWPYDDFKKYNPTSVV